MRKRCPKVLVWVAIPCLVMGGERSILCAAPPPGPPEAAKPAQPLIQELDDPAFLRWADEAAAHVGTGWSARQEILEALWGRFVSDRKKLVALPTNQMTQLHRCLGTLGLEPTARAEVLSAWVRDSGQIKSVASADAAGLLGAFDQHRDVESLVDAKKALIEQVWSRDLAPMADGKAEAKNLVPALRLVLQLSPLLEPTRREAILEGLTRQYGAASESGGKLAPSQAVLLAQVLQRIDPKPKAVKAREFLVAWHRGLEGKPITDPVALAGLIKVVRSYGDAPDLKGIVTALISQAWDQQLQVSVPHDAGWFALMRAMVPTMAEPQNSRLGELLRQESTTPTQALLGMSAQEIQASLQLAALVGLNEYEQRRLLVGWMKDGTTDKSGALEDRLLLLASHRRDVQDDALRPMLIQAGLTRLSDLGRGSSIDRIQQLKLARALATTADIKGQTAIRQKLADAAEKNRWFKSASIGEVLAWMALQHSLHTPEDQVSEGLSRWMEGSSAWKRMGPDAILQLWPALAKGKTPKAQASFAALKRHAQDGLTGRTTDSDSRPASPRQATSGLWGPAHTQMADATIEVFRLMAPSLKPVDKQALLDHIFAQLAAETRGDLAPNPVDLLYWAKLVSIACDAPRPPELKLVRVGPRDSERPYALGFEGVPEVDEAAASLGTSPRGGPFLTMVLAEAYKGCMQSSDWQTCLERRIQDEKAGPDQRALFNLARAYLEQIKPERPENPMLGATWLDGAMAVAESESMRLTSVQWLVGRLFVIREFDRAESLLKSIEPQFKAKASLEFLALMHEQLKAGKEAEPKRLAAVAKQDEQTSLRNQVKTLERHLEEAKQTGKPAADIASIEKMIAQAKADLVAKR